MQPGAGSSFFDEFAGDASSRQYDEGALQPHMSPATLTFHSAVLDYDYQHTMQQQTVGVVRFGILLALPLLLLFGASGPIQASENAGFALEMHVVASVLVGLMLAASFTRAFERYRERFMIPFGLLLGVGMTLFAEHGAQNHYVGYMLVIVGAYSVLGLRFLTASAVSIMLVAMYLAGELWLHPETGSVPLNSAMYLLAAFLVSAVGGYIYERQRRLAHFRLRAMEQARAHSEHCALHDPLTGLPNRRLLMERLGHAMARDKRNHTYAAALFIDLDNFKPVNDTYGHDFGDKVLKCVAERLKSIVRDTDTVTRIGGDEFVVLLEDLASRQAATSLLERVNRAFAAPIDVDGRTLRVEMSAGCAVDPVDARTPQELLQCADRAMYEVKKRRRRR